MIKAVMFDLDDTLLWDDRSINEAFSETSEAATEKYDIDPTLLEQAVRKAAWDLYSTYDTFSFTKMIGINPFEGLWGDFCDDTDDFRKLATLVPQYRADAWTEGLQNVGIDDAELGAELGELFPEIRRTKHYVYKDTFPILDTLKKDYHLLLLTNGSPNLQTEKLNGVPKLPPYFDHIVISGGYGRGKPERALFQHALDLLKVNNDETIMVGDKLTTDILGANEAEIPSVWINRTNMAPSKDIVPNYEIESLCELPNIIQSLK